MAINISLSGIKASDNVKILNNASIQNTEDVDISLEDMELNGQVELLQNLDIKSIQADLFQEMEKMDRHSVEYSGLKKLCSEESSRKGYVQALLVHLEEFSQGVVAKVISDYLVK